MKDGRKKFHPLQILTHPFPPPILHVFLTLSVVLCSYSPSPPNPTGAGWPTLKWTPRLAPIKKMKHAAGVHDNLFVATKYKVFHFNAGKGVTCAARRGGSKQIHSSASGKALGGGGWLKTNEPFLSFREGAGD